jgi:hypothetical protein
MPGFEFCVPTTGKAVPAGAEWLHEVKYDGYRLRVERDGDRVRLFTRNGYDWTGRYPWIVEAARKIRQARFVLDGEAVIEALHSRQHDEEVAVLEHKTSSSAICARWACAASSFIAPTTIAAIVALNADRWPDEMRLSDVRAAFRLQGLRQARRRYQARLQLGKSRLPQRPPPQAGDAARSGVLNSSS